MSMKSMPWKDICYFLIIITGCTIGTFRLKNLSRSSKTLYVLLVITLYSELISEILKRVSNNNLVVFHIYNPLQFVILATAYNYELKETNIIHSLIAAYVIFAVLNGLFWQPFFDAFCSYSFSVNVVLVSGISLYYLYQLLQDAAEESFTSYPLFWISIGYLIYNCLNLLGLGAFNQLSENSSFSYSLEVVRTMSNYLLYAMFAVAFISRQKSLNS